eukprot:9496887-Pyramimonas_sp.AAC.1
MIWRVITGYQRQRRSRFPEVRLRVFQAGSGTQDVSILGARAEGCYTGRGVLHPPGCTRSSASPQRSGCRRSSCTPLAVPSWSTPIRWRHPPLAGGGSPRSPPQSRGPRRRAGGRRRGGRRCRRSAPP